MQSSLHAHVFFIDNRRKYSKSREFVANPRLFLQAVAASSRDLKGGAQPDSHQLFMLLLSSFDSTISTLNSTRETQIRYLSQLFQCHGGNVLEIHEDFTNFDLSIEEHQSLIARLRSTQSFEDLHGPGKGNAEIARSHRK
jgi:hypothetical protein